MKNNRLILVAVSLIWIAAVSSVAFAADTKVQLPQINGLGTGVQTALGINVGTAGAVLVNPGTPIAVTVQTIAALKALTVSGLSTGYGVAVEGYYAAADGGGGLFYYDSSSSASDNGGTTIAPTAGSGRWIRAFSGSINVRWFGAKGDGTTDDYASVNSAMGFTAASGVPIYFPAGNYAIASTLSPSSANLRFQGDGWGKSIIRAKASAALTYIINSAETATKLQLDGLTFDGNRANVGTSTGTCYLIALAGTLSRITSCEITASSNLGVFLGASVAAPVGILIDACYIHDNGSLTNTAQNGVGLYLGGAASPVKTTISGCFFLNNYNNASGQTSVNNSCAIAMVGGSDLTISHCNFTNNFNQGGGQLFINGTDRALITGNTFTWTTGLNSDQTSAVEIDMDHVSLVGNVCNGARTYAWQLSGANSYENLTGNICYNVPIGININASSTTGATNIIIAENTINASVGVSQGIVLDSSTTYVSIVGNNFAGTTTPIVGGGTASVFVVGQGVTSGPFSAINTSGVAAFGGASLPSTGIAINAANIMATMVSSGSSAVLRTTGSSGDTWQFGSGFVTAGDWGVGNVTRSINPILITGGTTTPTITLGGSSTYATASPSGLSANHFVGAGTAPTIAAGAGAGTAPTISISGHDAAFTITLTTGTIPTLSAAVCTVTFNVAYGNAPHFSLTPSSSASALLSGVSMVVPSSTTTTFVLTAGATALTAATSYTWEVLAVQ